MAVATGSTITRTRTGAATFAAFAAFASLLYILAFRFLLNDETDRELTATGLATAFNVVIALSLVGLVVTVPSALSSWPRFPVLVSAAALALTAAAMLAFGTIGAIFASSVSDDTWNDAPTTNALPFLLLFLPKMVTGLVGFVGLAVVGRRHRLASVGQTALLVVAGLAFLVPPPPPAALLASLALLWLVVARREPVVDAGE